MTFVVVLMLGLGSLMMYSAITDAPMKDTYQSVTKGEPMSGVKPTNVVRGETKDVSLQTPAPTTQPQGRVF